MPAAFEQVTGVRLAPEPTAAPSSVVDGVPVGAPLAWRADLSPAWDVPSGVHGGVLLATALRAAGEAVALTGGDTDAHLPLRTAHASFTARPDGHELGLTSTVLRRGGTTAHVDVVVRAVGAERDALLVRALHARPRADADRWLDVPVPDVPGPDVAPPANGEASAARQWPMTPPPLFDHFDMRPAVGVLPWEPGWRPGAPARYARWSRYQEAPLLADGTLDPLALLPMADLPGPSVWVRYGPDEPVRGLLSLEMTFDVLGPVRDEWVLCDFRARVMGEGYVLVDCELWSAGTLVAVLRQTMMPRTLPTPAP